MNFRVDEPGAHAVHTSLEATQGSWPNSHVPRFSSQNKLFVCSLLVYLLELHGVLERVGRTISSKDTVAPEVHSLKYVSLHQAQHIIA